MGSAAGPGSAGLRSAAHPFRVTICAPGPCIVAPKGEATVLSREGDVMTRALRLELGAEVQCTDGVYGELRGVVIDPPRCVVTHLVVEQRHGSGLGRLVPIDLLRETTGRITLDCGREAVEHLPPAARVVMPGAEDADWNGDLLTSIPFYGLFPASYGLVNGLGGSPVPWVRDIVPDGEVEVASHERVHTTDGAVGRLRGVVIDDQHRLTQILLHEGHLWGKREIAIPMESVESVDGYIRLGLSNRDLGGLPPTSSD